MSQFITEQSRSTTHSANLAVTLPLFESIPDPELNKIAVAQEIIKSTVDMFNNGSIMLEPIGINSEEIIDYAVDGNVYEHERVFDVETLQNSKTVGYCNSQEDIHEVDPFAYVERDFNSMFKVVYAVPLTITVYHKED